MRRPRKLWKLRGRRGTASPAFTVNERDLPADDGHRHAHQPERQAISPDDFDRALVRLLDHS